MNLQMLKKAFIAYTSNSAKAIWSALAYPCIVPSTKACNVKDYRIWGAEGGVGDADASGEYVIPVVVRGKNYFDLAKVPFSNSSTQPYNNGIKATKLETTNRGDKIPIDLPVGKTIYLTLDVVDSQIAGTIKRVTVEFLDSKGSRVIAQQITSTIAHKTYSITLSKEVKYIQFYFQSSASANAVGDYMTMDNIMIRTEGEDVWEAYIKPQTVEVVLPFRLFESESVQKSLNGLPNLPQYNGTTIYETTTTVAPSGIEVQYYE